MIVAWGLLVRGGRDQRPAEKKRSCAGEILRPLMNTSRPINVGITGLGWPGERHAEAVAASPLGRVYAACDLSQERLAVFTETFRPEKTFLSFDEMLSDPDLHAVVICVPNFLHFALTLKALQAGKHVLCEKPPALNASQMQTLHGEARDRNLIYCFGRQMRFSPAMEAARRLISEGRLGRIYFAETMWVRSGGTPSGIDGWFTDRSKAGGGAMIDLGIHAIDAAWYLMGTPPPRSVSAQTYQNYPQLVRHGVFDVEDSGYGMIRFENRAMLHFKVSWAASLMDDIPENPKYGRSLLSTTLFGIHGSLRLTDVFNLDASVCSSPLILFEALNGVPERVNVPINDLRGDALRAYEFLKQDENFVRSVAGEESPINNSVQAIDLMKILDAVYRSSEARAEVMVG